MSGKENVLEEMRGIPRRGTASESKQDLALRERFAHHVGRGIRRFSMIGPGDRVLIGVSGGKDSLALSMALADRKKWVPIEYELSALQIEWREYPMSEDEKRLIDEFYLGIGIPLRRVQACINPPSFRGRFDCYLCARNRKRILFNEATRIGAASVALGHHLDDIVHTTMINLFFRGEFSTMMPVQSFFEGKIKIIRPLCEVRESEVSKVATRLGLPSVPARCPNAGRNRRSVMRDLLRQVSRIDKNAATNLYKAAWRINTPYLPKGPE